jgi:hypothetical protein
MLAAHMWTIQHVSAVRSMEANYDYLTQRLELLFKLGAGRTQRLGDDRQRRNHALCVRLGVKVKENCTSKQSAGEQQN